MCLGLCFPLGILSLIGYSAGVVVYPMSDGHDWLEVDLMNLTCPRPIESKEVVGETKDVKIGIPHEREESGTHTGMFCHGITDYAVCETSLLGFEDRQCFHSTWIPSEEDCKEAEKAYLVGAIEQDPCPKYTCSWLAKKIEPRKRILLQKVEVGMDRYTNSFVHPLFPEGQCKTSPCKTIVDSIIWIGPDYNTTAFCTLYRQAWNSSLTFVGGKLSYLSGTFYGNLALQNACNIQYCGTKGIRFSSGIVLMVMDEEVPLSNCSKETLVGIVPEWLRDLEVEELSYQEIEHDRCQDTLSMILDTGKASWEQIGRFYPTSPGYHRAYRINGDSRIESAIIMFQPGIMKEGGTRLTNLENTVRLKDWIGTPKGERGPSGILRLEDGTLYTPHDRLYRNMDKAQDYTPYIIYQPRHHTHAALPEHFQPNFNPKYEEDKLSKLSYYQQSVNLGIYVIAPILTSGILIFTLYKCTLSSKDCLKRRGYDGGVRDRVVINWGISSETTNF